MFGALIAMPASAEDNAGLNFRTLLASLPEASGLPSLEPFEARDGTRLWYRHYSGSSSTALVLIHGSATDSKYLSVLASAVAESGVADVYTPDLRGHGPFPVRRGDIDYIKQLEDDLADLVLHLEATNDSIDRVVIGGHSSGGGLAVRFAGGAHGDMAAAYLLLAPYLGHDAPTVRKNSGGWANPSLLRIVPLSILNQLGINFFNSAKALHFNLPSQYRDGSETLSYSYRLMTGFGPSDYTSDLSAVQVPLFLVAGSEDEALFAAEFAPTVRPLVPDADIRIVDGVAHLGIVVNEEAIEAVLKWLQAL